MTILALDTTSRLGSLALMRDGEVLESFSIEALEGFGHIVYQQILELLERHGLALPDVDCYAAAAGPGSFTGIRVGLTAVKALAEVHGKPVVAVSNLMALAWAGEGLYRAPVMDARRGEVFAAVYDEKLRTVVKEAVLPWAEFTRLLGDREVTLVASGDALFEAGGAANEAAGRWRRVVLERPLAEAVAEIAAERCASGEATDPEGVDANYVRRTDAELNWVDPA